MRTTLTAILLAILAVAPLSCQQKTSKPIPRRQPRAAPHDEHARAGVHGVQPSSHHDWRGEHQVPESLCTRCNASLIPAFKAAGDWCEEHGFPESFCPVCNPNAQFPDVVAAPADASDWCAGHGLPESMCSKCNPSLAAQFQAAGDWCTEHGFPESVCPVCNPQVPPAGAEQAAIEARTVRFRSPDIEDTAGIRTVTARHAPAAASVECTARIAFHGARVADIRAIGAGHHPSRSC